MLTSALVAFTAGGAQAAFECPVTGGDLVFGQEAKVNSLDMHASSTISTRNIAMHMFEALLTRDEDNNPILELAEKVDVSDDGLVYTFTLRDGIKFHNGKAMTSADVAGLVRPLQEGRHRERDPGQRRAVGDARSADLRDQA